MDYYECKEWLKTYKDMYYRVEYIENCITGLKSIPLGKESHASGKPKTKNDLILEKDLLLDKMREIKEVINKIDDLKLRCVIEYKYLNFMSFDEISEIMHYSPNTIKQFYGHAMNIIMKSMSKNHSKYTN